MSPATPEPQESKGWFLSLAKTVGPGFGCAMGLLYASAYGILFWRDKDLGDLAQVCFGFGFATAAIGLGRAVHLIASTQAENRINNVNLPSSSTIPEVQKEIDTQLKAKEN